jgi:hypothetical protein
VVVEVVLQYGVGVVVALVDLDGKITLLLLRVKHIRLKSAEVDHLLLIQQMQLPLAAHPSLYQLLLWQDTEAVLAVLILLPLVEAMVEAI